MNGGIYLVQDDGQLVEMTERAYDSEDLLQALLAKYPSLLAGDQMDSAAPRRWLLISREVPLPCEEGGAGRWSVDHLFLDQDAIPTLVEVKRADDTRIRREVVGQMLDYAANAVVYWPIDRIRAQFETNCEVQGCQPQQVLGEFLDADADQEQFWQKAKTNLQAGKVRLIFVADEIPAELRRIVEFLNAQTDPAEVLAVEIKQYVGQKLKALVPRVIGQTAEAQGKRGRTGARWDRERFFAALVQASSPEEIALAQDLMTFGIEISGNAIEWGAGKGRGSFTARLTLGSERISLFSVYTTGQFSLNIGWSHEKLSRLGLDLSEKYRAEVKSRLSVDFERTSWERGWPMANLSVLIPDEARGLKDLLSEFVSQLREVIPEPQPTA
jgi:hypothetical protein